MRQYLWHSAIRVLSMVIAVRSNNMLHSFANSNVFNYTLNCELLDYVCIISVGSVFTYAMTCALCIAVLASSVIDSCTLHGKCHTVVTCMALFIFVYGSVTTITCWLPDYVYSIGPRMSMARTSSGPTDGDRCSCFL